MREHISRQKKTTTGFSIPSLKHPTRGFGLESSAISRQAVPEIQPLHQPVTHDISRIPLRSQAKLSISQPGDKYEQEADSVAQQVMQRMAQPVNRQSIQREALPQEEEELQMKPLDINTLQREALPEEEEELQMKTLDISTLQREALPEDEEELQMKSLDISTLQREALPEDEEEELQMKSLDSSTLQREALPEEEEEELQMKSLDNRTLQREALPEEEEELQMKPMVQRRAGMAARPDLETSINQARGGGQAIADNIRKPMEVAFGADFSGVKVHTDGQSDQLNRSIQARAFTTGQDVFFRQGEYNPGSRGGQELLAHELTHVVQQNGRKNTPIQRTYQKNKQRVQGANPNVVENSTARVTAFGANWEVKEWRDHIKTLGLKAKPGSGSGGSTESGKKIFGLTNGDEIVCDLNGYWRHLLANGQYADNTGVANADNAQTHFWSSTRVKNEKTRV
ncbi:DUF4157 domain-containing protein [Nostoc sp. UHCC 0252]|uniref:eCIS core domain-containing protein n=1 Tax=Nostoc sp. UHCC 0252 TaxID=3110241 RepID=UPI002B1ED8A3|nr:DUF4157 domain-containing protein [Nostoc sp. UHCC 0252]MEA5602717.1 DUF4157 domain-containing protein [Nostoc sp. UHCC 0252]